ncbi:MAG: hypothetical protein GXY05_06045 [Clostridiales bacterium]|nr:hypothetical protein [Clostridiales bacterium]
MDSLHPSAPILNKLMKSRDLQEILDIGRPIFGNPLILVDIAFSVLAITAEPDINSPNWQQINSLKGIPVSAMSFTKLNSVRKKSLETGAPVLDSSADDGVSMLRKTLALSNRILGHLDSPLYYGELTEDKIAFFDLMGNLLAVQLQRELNQADTPDSMLDFFIYDLIEGKLSSPELIKERLRYFKWNIMGKGRVQIISVHRKIGEPELSNSRAADIISRLAAISSFGKAVSYGSEIKLICSVNTSVETDKPYLDALTETLETENLVAGISRPLPDIENAASCNQQAKKAAEIGMVLFPKKCVHFYDHYAAHHAMELCSKSFDPLQFCHSAIIKLWEYDREHDTDFLESLRIYLTNNQSIGKAAGALFIHRNTMTYRLSKILEITNLDLSDTDVTFNLLFSYLAFDFRHHWKRFTK